MIELFKADVREKNPAKGSLTLSIIGVLLIGFCYFLATRSVENSMFWSSNTFFLVDVVCVVWCDFRDMVVTAIPVSVCCL